MKKVVNMDFYEDYHGRRRCIGKYTGEVNEKGEADGKGCLTLWHGQEKRDGTWRNGKPHGTLTQMNLSDDGTIANTIVTEYVNGVRDGHSIARYADGTIFAESVYENDVLAYERFGAPDNDPQCECSETKNYTKLHFANGDEYCGEYNYNSYTKQGTYRFVNGDVFEGYWAQNWKDDVGCVIGFYKYADGRLSVRKYKMGGYWTFSKKLLQEVILPEKVREQVMRFFREPGKQNITLMGAIKISDGVYIGERILREDDHKKEYTKIRDGFGAVLIENGDLYIGEWKKDTKHGHAVYLWANGDMREGEWINGKKEGSFIYTYKNGEQESEEFKDNELIKSEPIASPKSSTSNSSGADKFRETASQNRAVLDMTVLDEALAKTVKQFGTESFRRGGKAFAVLNDLMPGDQNAKIRRRIKIAMDSGACDCLLNNDADIDYRMREAFCKLTDYIDLSEDIARETVEILARALL